MLIEGMLNASGRVDGVGSPVVAVDQIARTTRSIARDTTRADSGWRITGDEGAGSCCGVGRVDALKCGGPSVLREVVVEHPETGADYCFAAFAGRICEAEARAELGAIIVRNAHRNLQRLKCDVCRIVGLTAAGGGEETESGLVTQAVIHGEMWSGAPGILRVESEALHVLREAAVVGGSGGSAMFQHPLQVQCSLVQYSLLAARSGSRLGCLAA